MAATKVRVLFEFRNGNKNYLGIRPKFGRQVECNGEDDIGAIKAAFLVACQEHGIKGVEFAPEHKPASHD
jgi:hypothetical protein